ncbi:MAG TPA: TIGR00266 family protein [Oculatellaceae cyanobacterium]
MKHVIHGTTLQSLEITLNPGEGIYSQTHQMAWMTDSIKMDTNTGGGFLKGLMRSLSGASLFLTHFSPQHVPGMVAFCPRFPGTMIARQLAPGETLICRKESFLCAEMSVQLDIFFRQQIGGGLFGGEGFILQKVTGPGWVFLDLSGELVEKRLGPGEILRVHVGHVAVQEPTVEFGIQMISGFKNVLFGGDGIFLATLRGPGSVILQSMPIVNLAEEIFRHAQMPQRSEGSGRIIGDIVGGLFSGGE